jgi:hypothetical protein
VPLLPMPHVTVAYLPTTARRADQGGHWASAPAIERDSRTGNPGTGVKKGGSSMSGISLLVDYSVDSSPQAPHLLARRIKDQQAVPLLDFFSGKFAAPATGRPTTKVSSGLLERARVPC